MQAGEPASVWQLDETRSAFGDAPHTSVAGHQCQIGIDASKPTRIFTDLPGAEAFGKTGWPTFDAAGYYTGPLPRCGHKHKQKTIGRTANGEGFNASPMAAYPPKMCEFSAKLIYDDWKVHSVKGMRKSPCGSGSSSGVRTATTPRRRVSFTEDCKKTEAREIKSGDIAVRSQARLSGPEGAGHTASSHSHVFSNWNKDLPEEGFGRAQVISAEEIREATDEIETASFRRPIKDGIELPEVALEVERGKGCERCTQHLPLLVLLVLIFSVIVRVEGGLFHLFF